MPGTMVPDGGVLIPGLCCLIQLFLIPDILILVVRQIYLKPGTAQHQMKKYVGLLANNAFTGLGCRNDLKYLFCSLLRKYLLLSDSAIFRYPIPYIKPNFLDSNLVTIDRFI